MTHSNGVVNFGSYLSNIMPTLHEAQIGSVQDEIILFVQIFKFHLKFSSIRPVTDELTLCSKSILTG
jgi:hypothetical protein